MRTNPKDYEDIEQFLRFIEVKFFNQNKECADLDLEVSWAVYLLNLYLSEEDIRTYNTALKIIDRVSITADQKIKNMLSELDVKCMSKLCHSLGLQ